MPDSAGSVVAHCLATLFQSAAKHSEGEKSSAWRTWPQCDLRNSGKNVESVYCRCSEIAVTGISEQGCGGSEGEVGAE